MLYSAAAFDPDAMSVARDHLGERSHVCARVLDQEGRVIAVETRGLGQAAVEAEETCGEVWTGFWQGEARVRAERCLAEAFEGGQASFVGHVEGGATWAVELFPCAWQEGRVSQVIVLSSPVGAPPVPAAPDTGPQLDDALRETLHAIANLSGTATSAARILRRGVDADVAEQLAATLEQGGTAAAEAMERLRDQLDSSAPLR